MHKCLHCASTVVIKCLISTKLYFVSLVKKDNLLLRKGISNKK